MNLTHQEPRPVTTLDDVVQARESLAAPGDSMHLVRVLRTIADTAAETLELQEVFDRVAASIRELIPFDQLEVVRILDGHTAVVHASTVPCEEDGVKGGVCSEPAPLTTWSPRVRPRPGDIRRVDDASELDAAFPMDAMILARGVRSAMWEPFRSQDVFTGGLWLSSNQPFAFDDIHQDVLAPIAALLGSTVEHWRIWDGDRRRQERLDQLETLLPTLAESLDVREVFERLSNALQPVVPHHGLVLVEIDLRQGTSRKVASAGDGLDLPPGACKLSEHEWERTGVEFAIVSDIATDFKPETEHKRALIASGMRSGLRVPVRLGGEVQGFVAFLHREPSRYGAADVEIARRLADRIALTLSHHRLAEEARVAAEARERAERLEATVATLARELSTSRGRIVGVSSSWNAVLTQIGRVAPSETTVLITGESGTGKEVVSRLLHEGSPRAGRPMVAVNCAALPEQLLESELFGHEKGAFTGAIATKIGRLEQAAGGTLLLDEIAEMSPLVQAKFLRALEQREFQRLGGTRLLRADVRVIAATNRDLQAAIKSGRFREDLYYRLAVFEIRVPPLRERVNDILPLAESFLKELGRTMARPAAGISRDALDWLLSHPWPGNVRELRNAIERAILLCDGGLITRGHLPGATSRAESSLQPTGAVSQIAAEPLPAGGIDLGRVERGLVEKALAEARGNKAKAARLLGLTRAQLYSRIAKYELG